MTGEESGYGEHMTEQAAAQRVIEEMLASTFPDASPRNVHEVAAAMAAAGAEQPPTVEEAVQFDYRHGRLLTAITSPERTAPEPPGADSRAQRPVARPSHGNDMVRQARGTYDRLLARARNSVKGVGVLTRAQADRFYDAEMRALRLETHRLHQDLLLKAMEDPQAAEVVNTYSNGHSADQQRQFLYSEALYQNYVATWDLGVISVEELFGHLRILMQSSAFREYWEATRHHRASLPDDSKESQVGRMADYLLTMLDDADTDEWWVVGEPPSE